jgi:hypothetical protein
MKNGAINKARHECRQFGLGSAIAIPATSVAVSEWRN